VRFNASGYYNLVKGVQRQTVLSLTPTTAITTTANSGDVEIKGGELEVDTLVFEGFRFGGTLGITDQNYRRYLDPGNGFDRSHERIPSAPETTFTLAGTYTHDVGIGTLTLRADYSWQSKAALDVFNIYTDSNGVVRNASSGAVITDVAAARAQIDATTERTVGLINLRAGLQLTSGFELAAYIKNLTSERDTLGVINFPAPFSFVTGIRREPRTWGLSASYHW